MNTDNSPNKILTVTSPLLPDLQEFEKSLEEIWESRWITNGGSFHQRLEEALCEYLKVPYVSLFTNGTLPLVTALQALQVKGEVITTPYSFVATSHSIWWNGAVPVFADVDPRTGNIDPQRIEDAITPRTSAIMPVHVYGQPCDVDAIADIAKRHGLKVIYDAAHAFGVERGGRSILGEGDLSTLSFHATKVFNTIEGGAMVMHDVAMKQKIDYLKNFGFEDEVTVVGPGINSKMDEMRSAYGLLNLRQVDGAIESRARAAAFYRSRLADIPGIRPLGPGVDGNFGRSAEGVAGTAACSGVGAAGSAGRSASGDRYNYSYFPVLVDEKEYGMSRDALYEKMRAAGVCGRRYFYPLISTFAPYRDLPSADPANLPNAVRLADSVICLPMHHLLSDDDLERVMAVVENAPAFCK